MTTQPEDARTAETTTGEPTPQSSDPTPVEGANAANAPTPPAQKYHVDKVDYVGPPIDEGSPTAKVLKGEVTRGNWGIRGGVILMVIGALMIPFGIHGEVAFTLQFGEHNSFDVKTAVVGIAVMVLGFLLAVLTKLNVKIRNPSANPSSTGGPK